MSDFLLIKLPNIKGGYNLNGITDAIKCPNFQMPYLVAQGGGTYTLSAPLAFSIQDSAADKTFLDSLMAYQTEAIDVKTVRIVEVNTKVGDDKKEILVKQSEVALYNFKVQTVVNKIAGSAEFTFTVPDSTGKEELPGIKYTQYKEEAKATQVKGQLMINCRNFNKETAAHSTWDDSLAKI